MQPKEFAFIFERTSEGRIWVECADSNWIFLLLHDMQLLANVNDILVIWGPEVEPEVEPGNI